MSNHYLLRGATIFNGDNFLYNKDLIIKDNLILDIVSQGTINNLKEILVEGMIISAGFIDLQINGCGGVLYNDDISINTLQVMKATNLKYGCTSFLPTLTTTTDEEIKKAVEVTKSAYQMDPNSIIGIHIEGPYISKVKKGAHNPKYIVPISQDMVNFLCDSVNNVPIKITLAPEENDKNLIKQLVQAGVKVSIGHSNASYSEAMEGIRNGITLGTHLFNAMSAMEGRKPGVVGAILNSSNVYAGIIIDGHHVDYNTVNLVKKIKGYKLYIVTDAVTPMGTDMQEFYFANQKVFVKDGACINESGALAGANIDMMSSLKNAIKYCDIPLGEALRMASLYPARAMGLDLKLGRVEKNWIANLVIFNPASYEIMHTISNGKIMENM